MKLLPVMIATALLGACSSKPDPVLLVPAADAPYRMWLRTYDDGDYADQPFELFVRSKSAKVTTKILFAAQCKNVSVVQTPGTIYVLYDALALGSFNGTDAAYPDHPLVRLCPLHSADCANAEQQFALAGRKPSNVCTYRTSRAN